MPADRSKRLTLRRSCQACVKSKRRCDQGWPRCGRCLGKDINCEYVNAPFTVTSTGISPAWQYMGVDYSIANATFTPQILAPLQLEMMKEPDPNIIQLLVAGLRDLPVKFAQNNKNIFIHPDLYTNVLPIPVREIHSICKLNIQTGESSRVTFILSSMLRQHSAKIYRRLNQAASFEELLGYSQAFVLIQCILLFNEDGTKRPYSEVISAMLAGVAGKLFQQAPIQLPHALSPRRAWLFAESVRRTIIVCFMLRSAYSLNTRKYSVRTPFVDSLPFDLRTNLWDNDSDIAWQDALSDSRDSMVSLHEWSDGLAAGRVYDVSSFSALILAACKGRAVFMIPTPPVDYHMDR
ncbi:uncharacterized protein N7529_006874 [Penicillium soppii]|uniref:uncharacterized protein n=1 Tax=Penicillium soppii TaxID=69789 RepID=UPI00254962D8|nr:uncharacterized protein N7529_006874 [Penicillium soppii]KAJ5864958.1 hypothetical protein N7529_006874 [Penicillium soppii]